MSPIEKGIFYVLIFASLALMVAQVVQTAQTWLTGKPIDWTPHPVRSILVYILGQKKVQGSRPSSGAPMHLFIFYGFMALLLATTLLAIAEYGPVLGLPNFHRGTYYLWYELTFDVLGLFFVAGVAWALVRRGKAVRSQAGQNPISHDWTDFAALVLLLALGLTGYVLEAARIKIIPQAWDGWSVVGYGLAQVMPPVNGAGYKAIWWFHALLVAGMFVALPKMRLRHIVIAVLSAGGKSDLHMGALKPISMEEVERTGKIGVTDPQDYSQWHLMSLDACMSCGRCTEVCPAHGAGKTLNPKQVVADIHRAIRVGEGVPAAVTEEALWACTTCNACVEACPVLIRHVDLIVDARRGLVAEGALSGSAAAMLRQLGSTKHAWGQKAATREDWMKGLDIPLCRDGEPFEYLFWVGCAGSTDPSAVKTTKAVAALLKKAGVSFACLGKEEACTGDPARRVGDEFLFQDQASANHAMFAKYQVKRVVTACPHCLNTLANEYDQFGQRLEVFHHTQILNQLIQQRKLNAVPIRKGAVTYHDPCYLARVNGESDAPRGLLGEETQYNTTKPALLHAVEKGPEADCRIVEPQHKAHKTLCCGAGGGRMFMDEDPGKRPSERRAKELLETGAETVAVACPFCRIMLDASLKGQPRGEEVRLVDLAEMLEEANR
jgi:Fe-S oxidoreductase